MVRREEPHLRAQMLLVDGLSDFTIAALSLSLGAQASGAQRYAGRSSVPGLTSRLRTGWRRRRGLVVSPIRYRGHGRYEAYYPGLSIAGVLGHELIHMASYRRRAAQEGQLILQGGIRLHLTLRDGHLVATGGEAYVRTRPLRAPAAPASPESPGPGPEGEPAVPPGSVPPEPTGASTHVPAESGPGTLRGPDPDSVEAQLRREQQHIEQLLRELRAQERSGHEQTGGPLPAGREPASSGTVDRLERLVVLLRLAQEVPATQTQQALLALARNVYRAAASASADRRSFVVEAVA